MNPDRKRTPAEWSKATGLQVVDPNGWRLAGKDWREPISLYEFKDLCADSTITYSEHLRWR